MIRPADGAPLGPQAAAGVTAHVDAIGLRTSSPCL